MNQRKSNLEAKIVARYSKGSAIAKKKNVSFNVDEELLERLDSVVNVFKLQDGTTNRNIIIEDAILNYVEEAEDYFEKQNVSHDKPNDKPFDTAVYPALNENFGSVFMGEQKWYWVWMANHRVPKVKYIALYRGAPISAITHYAEITGISEPDKYHDNKRTISFSEPVELSQPIKIGKTSIMNVRKLFYTTLEKLKSSSTIEELQK